MKKKVSDLEIFEAIFNKMQIAQLKKDLPDLTRKRIIDFYKNVKKLLEKEDLAEDRTVEIYIDGAFNARTGIAGIGVVISSEDQILEKISKTAGEITSNMAEYSSLLEALKAVKKYNPGKIVVFSDSLLLVNQLNGDYSVKSGNLRKLYDDVGKMLEEYKDYKIVKITRKENKKAHILASNATFAKQSSS